MEPIHFIDEISKSQASQIAKFAMENADWNTTRFDVSVYSGFAVIFKSPEQLIATAGIIYLSSTWLGTVLVAKSHRRQGYASKIVKGFVSYVRSRRFVHISTIYPPIAVRNALLQLSNHWI